MAIDDLYTAGIASGWRVSDASTFRDARTLEADVAIVGTGAGGGMAAEILSKAGLRVLMLEEGPLRTAADFKAMDEARAYAELYQEGAGRTTSDGAIAVLQGRSVGGSTTVNWTSSFRTPPETLKHWADVHGVKGAGVEDLAPWFNRMTARLGIAPWAMPPNANNAVLKRGCDALRWESHVIPRNVRGCWNTGYCGLGCPVNAKQSMLVSTIPAALALGAELVHHVRIDRAEFAGDRVAGLVGTAMHGDGIKPGGVPVRIKARHYVLAGGAINTPALLLRSKAPDPYERIGRRTCIHPVNLTVAVMPEPIEPFYGAPQSVASDQFQWKDGVDGAMGYKLEVPPLQPGFTASVFGTHASELLADAASLPHMNAALALLRDGFHEHSPGGRARISDDGSPLLDYDVSDYVWDGVRRAYLSMAEVQFAAGAKKVRAIHLDARYCSSWPEAREHLASLPLEKFRAALFTAHLMGGSAMGENPQTSVTDSNGRFHHLQNLSIFDGSLFPTSIGANPQLSIYALVGKHASALAEQLRPEFGATRTM